MHGRADQRQQRKHVRDPARAVAQEQVDQQDARTAADSRKISAAASLPAEFGRACIMSLDSCQSLDAAICCTS